MISAVAGASGVDGLRRPSYGGTWPPHVGRASQPVPSFDDFGGRWCDWGGRPEKAVLRRNVAPHVGRASQPIPSFDDFGGRWCDWGGRPEKAVLWRDVAPPRRTGFSARPKLR